MDALVIFLLYPRCPIEPYRRGRYKGFEAAAHHRLICEEIDRFLVSDDEVLLLFAPPGQGMSVALSADGNPANSGNGDKGLRVKLRKFNCYSAKPYAPDGLAREWWQRLKNALGTASSAFVNASLYQLIEAAKLPRGGISEMAVNASLAFIESAKPQNEVESALLIQMACTHSAAMAVLGRFAGGHGSDRSVAAMASAAAKLLRAYATQVEALRRLRNGGSQFVRVEHVHVNEGGQAVIGNVGGGPEAGDPHGS